MGYGTRPAYGCCGWDNHWLYTPAIGDSSHETPMRRQLQLLVNDPYAYRFGFRAVA